MAYQLSTRIPREPDMGVLQRLDITYARIPPGTRSRLLVEVLSRSSEADKAFTGHTWTSDHARLIFAAPRTSSTAAEDAVVAVFAGSRLFYTGRAAPGFGWGSAAATTARWERTDWTGDLIIG